jgi:hypothetical protein
MYLIRKGWENVAGKVYKNGSFDPFKKRMKFTEEEWKSNEQINCFYIPDEYYPREEPVIVDDIRKTKMTNGQFCVLGLSENSMCKRVNGYFKSTSKDRIFDGARYESLYDDLCDGTDNVILLQDSFFSVFGYDDLIYVTNSDYTFINPIMTRKEFRSCDFSDIITRSNINILAAEIEPFGNEKHKGNFVIIYGTYIFLFDIKSEKKIIEILEFIKKLQDKAGQYYIHCASNGYYDDEVLFGTKEDEIKIKGLTDAFTCK